MKWASGVISDVGGNFATISWHLPIAFSKLAIASLSKNLSE